MKRKYRIVADDFKGFMCQVWSWYWPFWTEMGRTEYSGTNTFRSLKKAKQFISNKSIVYWTSSDGDIDKTIHKAP